MSPLVSIVITHYNYWQYLPECVESCLNQTYPNLEIIVVDDGSDTIAISPESLAVNKWVFHGANKGYAAAKNTGIRAANGEFICLIDADDALFAESVEMRMNAFEPHIDLVHGLALRWYGDKTKGYNKKTYCHAQGRLYRKSVYERFGLYYEGLRSMADKEFIYRIGVHPDSPIPKLINDKKIKKPVALYRKHDLAMHKQRRLKPKYNKQIKKTFEKRIKQLKKEGITMENTLFL